MPFERICFMVMPFGVKETHATTPDAPVRVDFDRVWNLLWKPLIIKLKYEPVRADADLCASLVREMIERLALSDLVLADVTLQNANVFYEVGVRHAAAEKGCVLVAADWSRQPFDTQSMRHAAFRLAGEAMTDAEAHDNVASLLPRVSQLAGSKTPCYELEGFPRLPMERTVAFRDALKRMNAWNGRVTALRELPAVPERAAGVHALVEEFQLSEEESLTVAFELLKLVRDTLDWTAMVAFFNQLPSSLKEVDAFREQYALAQANSGDIQDAIVALTQLIRSSGSTPEREGLLGGRYKRLWRKERNTNERAAGSYLDLAIKHYEIGRELDLNEYYCASNLPLLLKARGEAGDAETAVRVSTCVVAACERAINRGSRDDFLHPTLLVAAFHAGDLAKAKELAVLVKKRPTLWIQKTTVDDLTDIVVQTDPPLRDELAAILRGFTEF